METYTLPLDLTIDTSFYERELPTLIHKIKNDCSWKMGNLKSVVIVNKAFKQVVLTALHPQTEIQSKQKDNWVNFHILDGCVKIRIQKQTTTLERGQKFTLYDKIKYSLEAINETFLLITISPLMNNR